MITTSSVREIKIFSKTFFKPFFSEIINKEIESSTFVNWKIANIPKGSKRDKHITNMLASGGLNVINLSKKDKELYPHGLSGPIDILPQVYNLFKI